MLCAFAFFVNALSQNYGLMCPRVMPVDASGGKGGDCVGALKGSGAVSDRQNRRYDMKQGVDYFPLDTVLDAKFELIEADFGIKGFGVIVKLFQKIYAEQGYYVEFDRDIILVVAHRWGVNANLVSDIAAKAVSVGIFDRNMYEKHKILTSVGIQKRYLKMTRKRAFSNIRSEYSLLKVAQNPENTDFQAEKGVRNGQSKVKEIKKEICKEKYGELGNVFLSKEEYAKLAETYGLKKTEEYIEKLSLYIPERKKDYNSHYLTIRRWLLKDGIKPLGGSCAAAYDGVRRFN